MKLFASEIQIYLFSRCLPFIIFLHFLVMEPRSCFRLLCCEDHFIISIDWLDCHETAQDGTNIRDLKSQSQCFRQPILILVIFVYRCVEKEITRTSHNMFPNWMPFSITKSRGIFRNYCKRRGSFFSFLRNKQEIWGNVIIYLFVIPSYILAR